MLPDCTILQVSCWTVAGLRHTAELRTAQGMLQDCVHTGHVAGLRTAQGMLQDCVQHRACCRTACSAGYVAGLRHVAGKFVAGLLQDCKQQGQQVHAHTLLSLHVVCAHNFARICLKPALALLAKVAQLGLWARTLLIYILHTIYTTYYIYYLYILHILYTTYIYTTYYIYYLYI